MYLNDFQKLDLTKSDSSLEEDNTSSHSYCPNRWANQKLERPFL